MKPLLALSFILLCSAAGAQPAGRTLVFHPPVETGVSYAPASPSPHVAMRIKRTSGELPIRLMNAGGVRKQELAFSGNTPALPPADFQQQVDELYLRNAGTLSKADRYTALVELNPDGGILSIKIIGGRQEALIREFVLHLNGFQPATRNGYRTGGTCRLTIAPSGS